MWEKETSYKLTLKRNLIYEHCKQLYKETNFCDMTLVSSSGIAIPVHRVILALSSNLFKSCDESVDKIILPDFSSNLISSFVQFIYTGETNVNLDNYVAFVSLCSELMVGIPELLQTHETTEEESPVAEDSQGNNDIDQACLEDANLLPINADTIKNEEDEYEAYSEQFQPEDFNVVSEESEKEEKIIEQKTDQDFSSLKKRRIQKRKRKRGVDDDDKYQLNNLESSQEITSHHKDLARAILEIKKGRSTMTVAKKYGIPRSTIYRWLRRINY